MHPLVPSDKRTLRRERWNALRALGAARFPGAVGRIPNFTGAEAAAALLATERVWIAARILKCNPDLPQRPARYAALREGKRLYLAVPRLAERKPFLLLDPARLSPNELWKASSIVGAFELGRPVTTRQVRPIDLVLLGSVAVAPDGARLGKGGGYADLEYALLREAGRIGPRTPLVTTVHGSQVLAAGVIPMARHDVSVDLFATPTGVVRCPRKHRRPRGVLWKDLDPEKRAAIPALAAARRA